MLEVDVLGPLVVTQDGEDVTLPGGRSTLLIAVLATAAPDTVSADALLEALWPEDGASRGALQVLVHRVRRRLGEGSVVSAGQGYRLVADAFAAEEFLDLVARGREQVDVDPAQALADLDVALGLWRGAPFGELAAATPEVVAAATRLTEAHVDALETRFEAALTTGRAADLVPELREAVAEHPLRERLHGQLMLALYRSGRTADALDAYRAARAELVGELGLEPGPLLRDLERAILVEDPVLAAPPAPLVGPDRPVRPAQLPGPDPAFAGRPEEVGLLVDELRSGSTLVAIAGPGGAGKSALALEVANAVASRYTGGQLYVDLRGALPDGEPRGVEEVLDRFLRSLGMPHAPTDPEEAAAELRTRTAAAPVLVVLDDAATLAQVRPLLPSGPSAAIVTSRPVLGLPASLLVHLEELTDAEAMAVLERAAGQERVRREPEAARRIVAACGNLPLALRIAGARLAAAPTRRLAVLADRLADERHRLDELAHGDLAVRASIAVGLRGLDPTAPRLLAALGVVDLATVTPVVAARLADLPLAVARRRLDDLAEARLLVPGVDEEVAMHDLVRYFACERAREELTAAERAALVHRGYEHYLASARAASRAFTPGLRDARLDLGPQVGDDALPVTFADGPAAAAWLRRELGNVQAIVAAVVHEGSDEGRELAAALLAPLVRLIYAEGLFGAARPLYAPVLDADEPRTVAEAVVWADSCLLRDDDAGNGRRIAAAVDVLRDRGGAQMLAGALNIRGLLDMRAGRHERAVEWLEESLEALLGAGLTTAATFTRQNLVDAYAELGRLDEAAALARDNVAVSSGATQALSMCNLGLILHRAGRYAEAHEQYAAALPLLRAAGESHSVGIALWYSARTLEELGRHDEAARARREAMDVAVGLGILQQAEAERLLADPPEELELFRRV